jgi:hypothetical protein
MPGADARKIDTCLSQPGIGAALYSSYDGATVLTVSFGNRFADIGTRHCPANYGEFLLRAYVPPEGTLLADEMISPALRNRDVIPQIAAPPRAPSRTVHPGDRTGLESVMPVLGLEPAPDERFVIEGFQEPEPPPPAEQPAEPSRGPRSWWDQWR